MTLFVSIVTFAIVTNHMLLSQNSFVNIHLYVKINGFYLLLMKTPYEAQKNIFPNFD